MTSPDAAPRSSRALEALLKQRDLQTEDARGRLARKQQEIALLHAEVVGLERRRSGILERTGDVLRSRIALDAIIDLLLGRRRRLRALRSEALRLLEAYRESSARRDAVRHVRDRRVEEAETVRRRRVDEMVTDLAAARMHREARESREEA
jgi:hypothetical protein